MRESEAKTKQCPLLSISVNLGMIGITVTPSINALQVAEMLEAYTRDGPGLCRGRDCMLWRDHANLGWGSCGLVGK